MRLVLVVTIAWSAVARADDAAEAVARGEAFGRQGAWTQAIEQFKAADRIAPRAQHACLIGLAYSRRELWAQAELFFDLCQQRATATDPAPDWLPDAEQQLADKLAATGAAAVTIAVAPASATAAISVSSFAPGETFAPRTIHLAHGNHALTIVAPGYVTEHRELVVTDATPQTIAVALHAPEPRGRMPLYVIGAGVVVGLAGLGFDELVLQPARDRYATSQQGIYEQVKAANHDALARDQVITVGLFATAAVAIAAGVALRYTVYGRRETVHVGALPTRGGALATVEWTP